MQASEARAGAPMDRPDDREAIARLLRARRTSKVLAAPDDAPIGGNVDRAVVDAMLADAAHAPFHYPHPDRDAAASAVPWRATKLDGPACRALAARAERAELPIGSVARMLRAADGLVLVWFTPEGEASDGEVFAGSERNLEHVAAAGAFAQSFLLAATAAGRRTYWSSGGVLRAAPVTDWLDVPDGDVLVGALFLFPTETGTAEVKDGKWRDGRGEVADWSRWHGGT